jgi:16S rRNA (adenine1518-N6/adenine1519-N6)-dimethyltransferase
MMEMDLCDYKQMQQLLAAQGFHFSKAKGQNFLTASWVPQRIAEESGLDKQTGVVEIGPGVGCLTEQLALRAGKVVSFEVDELLRPVLAQTLAGHDNVEVVFGDVMRRDLAQEVSQSLAGLRPVLCANLPYNITTPVLTQIYEARCFETVTVMVQKEVAQRMCALPGQKDYGAFTLLTQWYAQPELLFEVSPDCFVPQPKVTSAVVHMTMRTQPPVAVEEKALFRLVRAAFNQRRKTLVNALDGVCGKERARQALEACGFSQTVRGEALSLADFAALTMELENN